MPRIHTHYDNLKVTRNAPPEVIRAAYKTLCQKFHPDRNPDDENAKKTFLLIRAAYETLSDPEKRRLHDAWIASVESTDALPKVERQPTAKTKKAASSAAIANLLPRNGRILKFGFWLLIVVLILVGFFLD